MASIAPVITGTSFPGNFLALKGENCTLQKIRGVKVLEDEYGNNLLNLIRQGGGGGGSSDVQAALSHLLSRVDAVEKYLQTLPPPSTPLKGEKGERGEKGEPGESIAGPQGPRGKDGSKKLSLLEDVNLDGLDDGATLIWSSKDKKWVVGITEE